MAAGVIGRHVLHFASSVDADEWNERGYDRWVGYHQPGSAEYSWYYPPFHTVAARKPSPLSAAVAGGYQLEKMPNLFYSSGTSRLTVIIHVMQYQCYPHRRPSLRPTRAREGSNGVGRQIYMGICRLAVRAMMVRCSYTGRTHPFETGTGNSSYRPFQIASMSILRADTLSAEQMTRSPGNVGGRQSPEYRPVRTRTILPYKHLSKPRTRSLHSCKHHSCKPRVFLISRTQRPLSPLHPKRHPPRL